MWITMAHERSREAGVSSSKLTIVVIIALRKTTGHMQMQNEEAWLLLPNGTAQKLG